MQDQDKKPHIFEQLLTDYVSSIERAHGYLARPNDTFYAHSVVSESFHWIRSQVAAGRSLTPEGEKFAAGAACYLAYLAYQGFARRGYHVSQDTRWIPGNPDNGVGLVVQRERDGQMENYVQDFWLDFTKYLLTPPQQFPVMKGAIIVLGSLSHLSPEYCYMYGTHFTSWPQTAGNWPQGDQIGGLQEDFDLARAVLIEDLLTDIGIKDREDWLRQLSNWVVWPIYGWQSNDYGQYNLMTLIDQIVMKKSIDYNNAVLYLRHLLQSQIFNLRLLAARTLLVMGEAPQTPLETMFYNQAVKASDFQHILPYMARYYWMMEGKDAKQAVPQTYIETVAGKWVQTAHNGPRDDWARDPALNDPIYHDLSTLGPDKASERREKIDVLMTKYPGNWFMEVCDAHEVLQTGNREEGEQRLRNAAQNTPGEAVAHLTLGTWLIEQDRYAEAQNLYFDMVERWPWDVRAVGNAMWSVTRTLVNPD